MCFENKYNFNERWFIFGLDCFHINKEMSFNNITGTSPCLGTYNSFVGYVCFEEILRFLAAVLAVGLLSSDSQRLAYCKFSALWFRPEVLFVPQLCVAGYASFALVLPM